MNGFDTSFTDSLFGTQPQPPKPVYTAPAVGGGMMWFVCCLPLLGLFLENFAVSKWAGIFLWIAVPVMMIACCFVDHRKLKKLCRDESCRSLAKWRWLVPVYVFKREKLFGRETYKAIMLVIFCAAALFMNGFVSGRSVNTDSIPVLLENSYVQNLDNFSGTSASIIGEQLDNYLEETDWSCTKKGDVYTAVCSGKKDGVKTEVVFKVVHDGFTYQSVRIDCIQVNGEKLVGDDYKDTLTRIFIPEALEDSSSEESSADSYVSA